MDRFLCAVVFNSHALSVPFWSEAGNSNIWLQPVV